MIENQEDKEKYLCGCLKEKKMLVMPWKLGWGYTTLINSIAMTWQNCGSHGTISTKVLNGFSSGLRAMLSKQNSFDFDYNGGWLVQALREANLLDHQPIYFFISWGVEKKRLHRTGFILKYVSHLQKPSCITSIKWIWTLFPRPRENEGWVFSQYDAISWTMTFLWGYCQQIASM